MLSVLNRLGAAAAECQSGNAEEEQESRGWLRNSGIPASASIASRDVEKLVCGCALKDGFRASIERIEKRKLLTQRAAGDEVKYPICRRTQRG